jgi:hypothetical protein
MLFMSIIAKLEQIINTLECENPPFQKLPNGQQEVVWNFTGSIISLISSLAESQDTIVEAISKLSSISNFLFGLLAFEATPDRIVSEVLACLATLLEDNKVLAQKTVDHEDWLKKLIEIKDSKNNNAVSACGVLHNIFVSLQWYDHNTPMESVSDAILIPTLVNFMEQAQTETNGTNDDSTHSTPDQVLQLALEITASIATSLQEALEHGSRHEKEFEGFDDTDLMNGDSEEMDADGQGTAAKDDEVEMEVEAYADENGEMNENEMDADMELVTGDGPDEQIASEQLTLDWLVRIAAPRVLLLASEKNYNTSHALSALNNIAWTISTIDFSTGHLDNLYKFWSPFSQRIWNEIVSPVLASDTADIELAAIVTSLAWAVSRSVKGIINIKPGEQLKFMALYQASRNLNGAEENGIAKVLDGGDDAFQGLGVKSIGVLGNLALDPASIDLNKEIGVFLLTVLSALPDTPPADAVEALNQLFDIYADKSYSFDEPVFWGNNFLKYLEEIQPKVKKMAKEIDKRLFPELRGRADEAVHNLNRFLIYKRNEKKGPKRGD